MANTLISVIIPVYNCQEYLEECIDSLLCQSYPNIEIILVNDGSTDRSPEICNHYSNLHPNIRTCHQRNRGAAAARKAGMEYAAGEYFLFVDADDWVEKDYVLDLISPALAYGTDITIGYLKYLTPGGCRILPQHLSCGCYDRTLLENTVFPMMLSAGSYYTAGISPNMCGKLFKREIAEGNLAALDTGLILGEDGFFTYACLLDCDSVCVIPKAGYIYRQNAASVTQNFNPRLLAEGLHLKQLYGHLAEEKQWNLGHQLDEYLAYICSGVVVNMMKAPNIHYRDKKKSLSDYVDNIFPHGILRRIDLKTISLKDKCKLFLIQHRLFFCLSAFIKLNATFK